MGWALVAADSAQGRLEATATTRWFGFKDDVVVRVRPDGAGSRVDVRSVSRVGGSDVGTNAARIRGFVARITDAARGSTALSASPAPARRPGTAAAPAPRPAPATSRGC